MSIGDLEAWDDKPLLGSVQDLREAPDPDSTALVLHYQAEFPDAQESFRVAFPVLVVRLAHLKDVYRGP